MTLLYPGLIIAVLSFFPAISPLAAVSARAESPDHPAAPLHIAAAEAGSTWVLSAGQMSYAIGVNNAKLLQTLYWGPRLTEDTTLFSGLPPAKMHPELAAFDTPMTTTPLEYPGWSGGLAFDPALKASFPDGDRSTSLEFLKAEMPGTSKDTLVVTTRDTHQGLLVELHYRLYPEGILARWSVIRNEGKVPATIEQAASATWNLPSREDYRLSWLTGHWGAEWQLHQQAIAQGSTVLESRRGSTSHQANPWFQVSAASTSEAAGPVWFGELGWSGSWRINVEETDSKLVRITGGYNPFDFGYKLAPGAELTTPMFYAGYTAQGVGEASRILHRFQLGSIVPQAPKPKVRPVLFNSWEATEFAVNEEGQIALAEKAAKLGAERLVIDDGWFGQRNDDHAGLGDWYVNPQKFPHGLKPVIDRAHALRHGLRHLGRAGDGES